MIAVPALAFVRIVTWSVVAFTVAQNRRVPGSACGVRRTYVALAMSVPGVRTTLVAPAAIVATPEIFERPILPEVRSAKPLLCVAEAWTPVPAGADAVPVTPFPVVADPWTPVPVVDLPATPRAVESCYATPYTPVLAGTTATTLSPLCP